MLQAIQTLPFPDWLANVNCTITLYKDGISEEGEPLVDIVYKGKCIFSEKSKRVINEDSKADKLIGTVYVKGDIAPDKEIITDGYIEFDDGKQMEIINALRIRNPNGTIHHTKVSYMIWGSLT